MSSDSNIEPRLLPYAFASRHKLLLLDQDKAELLHTAQAEPYAILEARRFAGRPLRLVETRPEDFNLRLQQLYEQDSSHATQAMEDLGDSLDLEQAAEQLPGNEDLLEGDDDAPIIRLINALLTQAIREGASDIHIEPYEHDLAVRLRVDGVLREILTPRPKASLTPLIVSRVKIMGRLDIAEKRIPQDGRIRVHIAGRSVDVRVSTLPANHGERVVMRILDQQAGRLDLGQLGMTGEMQQRFDKLVHKAHGVILVTGPTGSGKSTTLYAGLGRLNAGERNIMTVEDPVEYDLHGISQSPVNIKAGMTFAKGLRAILRQDPDVIMVGEIRDLETAEISVQASLTGHLVLSTLHTNSAAGAATRLRDMGVEPFLLSSSLVGILSQRLVRTLCPHCKQAHIPTAQQCVQLGLSTETQHPVYQAKGCVECGDTGYRGRAGIFELVEINNALQEKIHDGAGEHELEALARQTSPGILQDGVRRVLEGQTSIDEILRVTRTDH